MEAAVDDKSNELNVDVHNVKIMEHGLKDSTRMAEENFQSSKYMDHIIWFLWYGVHIMDHIPCINM